MSHLFLRNLLLCAIKFLYFEKAKQSIVALFSFLLSMIHCDCQIFELFQRSEFMSVPIPIGLFCK